MLRNAVQAALAASDQAEQADQACQQALQQLQELKRHVDELIQSLLLDLESFRGQAIWSGAAPLLSAAFANEEALWLALCLQVCLAGMMINLPHSCMPSDL